jgi:hypothetical protein
MAKYPFDFEVSEEEFFQDGPSSLVKIVRKTFKDIDEAQT